MTTTLVTLLLLATGQTGDAAPSAGAGDEAALARLLHPFFVRQAEAYEFFLDAEKKKKLRLDRKPVMTWKGDGSWFGDVFVWTYAGRAELIGCMGSWKESDEQRGVFHEFHSLALGPLSRVHIGPRHTWSAKDAGVVPRVIAKAAPPNESQSLRLGPRRRLARRFSAHMKSETGTDVLRMLPQPLFRYSRASDQVLDGAIFAYVWTQGTDPEVMLMIEARKTQDGVKWHYAPLRFTWREVWLKQGDEEVWRVAVHDEQHRTTQLKEAYVTVPGQPVSLEALRRTAKEKPRDVD